MLVGKFSAKIDTKNRLQVPLRLRESGGQDGKMWTKFYLTLGTEKCLYVFTPEGWRKLMEEMGADKALSDEPLRRVQRLVAANAEERECDAEGRVIVSEELQKYAGLKQEIIWVGAVSRAEIWNKDDWAAYNEKNAPQLGQGIDIVSRAGLALPRKE